MDLYYVRQTDLIRNLDLSNALPVKPYKVVLFQLGPFQFFFLLLANLLDFSYILNTYQNCLKMIKEAELQKGLFELRGIFQAFLNTDLGPSKYLLSDRPFKYTGKSDLGALI